jgi:hypothetical protein
MAEIGWGGFGGAFLSKKTVIKKKTPWKMEKRKFLALQSRRKNK